MQPKHTKPGVVILVSEKSFASADGHHLLSALVAAAERSDAAACVQLDHGSDLGLIESAFSLGAGAVLADGSHLPFHENVALVATAADLGEVEAELAGIAGDEDVARAHGVATLYLQTSNYGRLAARVSSRRPSGRVPRRLLLPRPVSRLRRTARSR